MSLVLLGGETLDELEVCALLNCLCVCVCLCVRVCARFSAVGILVEAHNWQLLWPPFAPPVSSCVSFHPTPENAHLLTVPPSLQSWVTEIFDGLPTGKGPRPTFENMGQPFAVSQCATQFGGWVPYYLRLASA